MRVPLRAAGAAAAGTTTSLLLLLLLLGLGLGLGLKGAVVGVRGVSILGCLNSLDRTHCLQAGNYSLVMQTDCNLVVYEGPRTKVWETKTGGKGTDCRAQLQASGHLELYNQTAGGSIIWESSGDAGNGVFLSLEPNGNLSIKMLKNTERALWSVVPNESLLGTGFNTTDFTNQTWGTQSSVLYMLAGYQLLVGSSLNSGNFSLTLNSSCYLQLHSSQSNSVVWHSNSSRLEGEECKALVLHEDGNLEIVGSRGGVAWSSNCHGPTSRDSYVLYLSAMGNVSVFSDLQLGDAIWTAHHLDEPLLPDSGSPSPQSRSHKQLQSWCIPVVLAGATIVFVAIGALVWGLALYYGRCLGVFNPAGKRLSIELLKDGGRCLSLSLSVIRQATNRFEKKLGQGGFGKVYHGKLADGRQVAVKVLSAISSQGKDEFYNEIKLLSVVHHQYLVSLVGYCLAWKTKILVYEYMSGGDLHHRLHGDTAVSQPLSWDERTRIVMQVAEGLEYLHHGCRPAIFHRDVKSNNILLDDKMCAKVADFGLSKLVAVEPDATHITTAVKGTFGYMDPEYYQTRKLTDKSDVYAFGVLLMEIVTARHPTDPRDHVFIGQRVRQAWKAGQILELCDPNLRNSHNDFEFTELIKLSLWCVKTSGRGRPSMAEIVQQLRDLDLVQLGPLRSMKVRPLYDSQDNSVEALESGGSETDGTDDLVSGTEGLNYRSGSLRSSAQMENLKSPSSQS